MSAQRTYKIPAQDGRSPQIGSTSVQKHYICQSIKVKNSQRKLSKYDGYFHQNVWAIIGVLGSHPRGGHYC